MAKFDRLEVYNTILDQGLVPVFYNGDFEIAKKIVSAIAKGGGKLAELTNRGQNAGEIFAKLVKYFEKELPQFIFGIGSIIDPYTASIYINNGANFIVGPILNPKISRLCNRRRIPYSPGCGTATEISLAEELGSEIVKIFPGGTVGGPNFVKYLLAPSPRTKLMPTGGVDITEESIKSWFEAGIVAAGIGSKLITKKLVESEDWDGISQNVSETLKLIQKFKK